MTIVISSLQALIVPVMAVFAYYGWYRGFYREVGTAAGLAVALALTTDAGGQALIGTVNRSITLGPRIINELLGRGPTGIALNPPIPEDPGDGRNLLFRIVVFIVITALTYTLTFPWERVPGKNDLRKPGTFWEKVLGAVFGGLVGYLWMATIQVFTTEFANLQGQAPLLSNGATITLPQLIGIGFIINALPTLAVLGVVILIILILFRLPKLWQ